MKHLAITTYRSKQMPNGTPFLACPDNAVAALHVSGKDGVDQLCVLDDDLGKLDADDLVLASFEEKVLDLDIPISQKFAGQLAARLKLAPTVPIGINRTADLLKWLFEDASDRDGELAVRPVMVGKLATSGYGTEIVFGGHRVQSLVRKGEASVALARTMAVQKADILRIEADALRAKMIGYLLDQHGLPFTKEAARDVIGIDLAPVKPQTTIGDTFTDTNGTALTAHTPTGTGGFSSWTNVAGLGDAIQSNQLRFGPYVNNGFVRAEYAFASADQDVSFLYNAISNASNGGPAAAVRFNSANTECYWAISSAFGTTDVRQYRISSGGSFTQIGSTVTISARSLPTTEFGGISSTNLLTGKINGSTQISNTDTNITGNLYAGLACGMNNVTIDVDDFSATDNAAAATAQNYLTLLGVG